MMKITLRAATEADKPFCKRVHHAAYRDVVTRQFGQWDEAKQDSFFDHGWASYAHELVELDGKPIGCFSRQHNSDHIFLAEVAVHPDFQNRGVGSALVKREQEEGRRLGLPVRLRVLKENAAQQLYKRLGFVATGETETHRLMEWTANHTSDGIVAKRAEPSR